MAIVLEPYFNKIQVDHKAGQKKIFDPVRRIWVILTPEELVRQVVIHYLINEKAYSARRMSVEKAIRFNTMKRRYDLAVYDKKGNPNLLVECKSPHIALALPVFDQVNVYNEVLQVQHIWITNGHTHYVFMLDRESGTFHPVYDIPGSGEMI